MRIRRIFAGLLTTVIIAGISYFSISGPYAEPEPEAPPEPPPTIEDIIPEGERQDSEMMLRVLFGDGVRNMSMERYLFGVVAAEMPAEFRREALQAQAVVSRTYAMYNMLVQPQTNHPQADVCTNSACCMAYHDDDRLQEIWGNNYEILMRKVVNDVIATDGVYIAYRGQPILAVFHSSSARHTEASRNVWIEDIPYLQSVPSPELDLHVPDFVTEVHVTGGYFIDVIQGAYPDAVFPDGPETWITDVELNESGRVSEITIGGVEIKGTEMRELFDLRSTFFTAEWTNDQMTFTVTGYGHGVGMSQYGANTMAANDRSYSDIIYAYYKGVELTKDAPAG